MKRNVFEHFGSTGTRLAPLLLGVLVARCSMGCLVTNKIEFGEPNVAPNVAIVSPRQSISTAPSLPDPECAANMGMKFEVVVNDANVDDELRARLFINGQLKNEERVRTTGVAARGTVPTCAKRTELEGLCSHVELLVGRPSSFLVGEGPYGVSDASDVTRVEWWVLGPTNTVPNASLSDCLALLGDGGVP